MNKLLIALINHLLALAETLLVQEDPLLIKVVEEELSSLVQKIEHLLIKPSTK